MNTLRGIVLAMTFLVIGIWVLTGCASSPTAAPAPAATLPVPITAATTIPAAQPNTSKPAATVAPKSKVQVEAYDDYFRPEKITVTVGSTVTWVNLGIHDHTISHDT